MRRELRAAGWGLTGLGVVVATVVVLVGAFGSRNDTALSHWALWATVVALAVAAAGVLPLLWDKLTGRTERRHQTSGRPSANWPLCLRSRRRRRDRG